MALICEGTYLTLLSYLRTCITKGQRLIAGAEAREPGSQRAGCVCKGLPIKTGTCVRLKPELFNYSRPHLLFHARQRDVGVVSPPSKQSPAMARLYVIVHFDECGRDHRVLPEELEEVAEEQTA